MDKHKKPQFQKEHESYLEGLHGFEDPTRTSLGERFASQQGAQERKRREALFAQNPYSWVGFVLAVLLVIGYGYYEASKMQVKVAQDKARVAPAALPTHYVTNAEAQYFYASGSRKDQPAGGAIVEPNAGKCFDLNRINQSMNGRVVVDLPDYNGRVFRMYTSETTFAPLPSDVVCEYEYYMDKYER